MARSEADLIGYDGLGKPIYRNGNRVSARRPARGRNTTKGGQGKNTMYNPYVTTPSGHQQGPGGYVNDIPYNEYIRLYGEPSPRDYNCGGICLGECAGPCVCTKTGTWPPGTYSGGHGRCVIYGPTRIVE